MQEPPLFCQCCPNESPPPPERPLGAGPRCQSLARRIRGVMLLPDSVLVGACSGKRALYLIPVLVPILPNHLLSPISRPVLLWSTYKQTPVTQVRNGKGPTSLNSLVRRRLTL